MLYLKGTLIVNKEGTPVYEKLGDLDWDWWVSLDSNYLVERLEEVEVLVSKNDIDLELPDELLDMSMFKKKKVKLIEHDLRPESEKPLYRNGKLNRFGWKWTDSQVQKEYGGSHTFVLLQKD